MTTIDLTNLVSTVEIVGDQVLFLQEEVINLTSVDETTAIVVEGLQGLPGPSGPPGRPGDPGGSLVQRQAQQALGGHRVVLMNANDRADYASNAVRNHSQRVIGLTVGAAAADETVLIQSFGELTEPSWNWVPDFPVFLGTNGLLTQAQPGFPAAKFQLVVGFPISNTTIFINLREPIFLT